MRLLARAWPLLASALFASVALSCSAGASPGEPGALPDLESFKSTSAHLLFENRCGALDCHGHVGRPLRIYSQNGLRLAVTNDGPRATGRTTDAEIAENYLSVIGLEPELLAKAFATGDYDNVQLLLKPLGSGKGIRHKGGTLFQATQTDPGWQCLIGWVLGGGDAEKGASKDQCEEGAQIENTE